MDISRTLQHLDTMKSMYKEVIDLGPCPDDASGTFELSKTLLKVDCTWFMTSTKGRCNNHIEGEPLCNSICGRYESAYNGDESTNPSTRTGTPLHITEGEDLRIIDWTMLLDSDEQKCNGARDGAIYPIKWSNLPTVARLTNYTKVQGEECVLAANNTTAVNVNFSKYELSLIQDENEGWETFGIKVGQREPRQQEIQVLMIGLIKVTVLRPWLGTDQENQGKLILQNKIIQ